MLCYCTKHISRNHGNKAIISSKNYDVQALIIELLRFFISNMPKLTKRDNCLVWTDELTLITENLRFSKNRHKL